MKGWRAVEEGKDAGDVIWERLPKDLEGLWKKIGWRERCVFLVCDEK